MKSNGIFTLALITMALSSSAHAGYHYNCTVAKGDDGVTTDGDPMDINIEGKEMTTSITGNDKMTMNENYKPEAANKGYAEFAGASIDDVGSVEVLVNKGMIKGSKKGTAKFRARGEGFEKEKFDCTLK